MKLKLFTIATGLSACLTGQAAAEVFEISNGQYFALRQAVSDAESNQEADTILLAPGGNYSPGGTLSLDTITTPITIYGRGATINGSQADPGRLFDVSQDGRLTVVDLNVTGISYQVGESFYSGGVMANRGSSRLRNVTVTGTDIDATQNPVFGAVLGNSGSMGLENVTLSGNRAEGEIYGVAVNNVGDFTMGNTTIADNRFPPGASGSMAAIDTSGGDSFATNNSIVADNDGDNCTGPVESSGGNMEDGNSCGFDQPFDQVNTDPMLEPIGDNGGNILTQAPASNGPAVNGGRGDACTPMDARGMPRPEAGAQGAGGRCDVGALEVSTAPFGFPNTVTGAWYDPDQSGHGFMMEVLPGNRILATWFVFNGGHRDWVQAAGTITDGVAKMTAYQIDGGDFPPGFDPSTTSLNYWGTLSIVMHGCDSGTATWMPDRIGYALGGMPLTRLTTVAGLRCN